jgi:hypothetical protein
MHGNLRKSHCCVPTTSSTISTHQFRWPKVTTRPTFGLISWILSRDLGAHRCRVRRYWQSYLVIRAGVGVRAGLSYRWSVASAQLRAGKDRGIVYR